MMNLIPPREMLGIISISIPLMIFYLAEVLIGLTDLFVVGQLGTKAVSAVGLGKTIVLTYTVMSFSVISIVSVLIAEQLGSEAEGNEIIAKYSDILSSGVAISFILGVVGIILFELSPILLRVLNYDHDVRALFSDYIKFAQFLIFPALIVACFRNLLNALSRTIIFAYLSGFAVVSNVILNYMLVFGFGPIPQMGVTGAGLATLIVHMTTLVGLFIYTILSRVMLADLINPFKCKLDIIKKILRLGLPAGAQQFLEGGLFLAVLFLMGMFSADWLAATSVIFAILEVTFVICLGFSEIVSAQISKRLGARRYASMRGLVNSSLLVVAAFMVASGIAIYVAPEAIVSIFFKKDSSIQVTEITIWLAMVTAFFLVFDGLQVVSMYILRGMQDTMRPFIVGVIAYWVIGLGSGVILAFIANMGAKGLWYGFCIGLVSAAFALMALIFLRLSSQPNCNDKITF